MQKTVKHFGNNFGPKTPPKHHGRGKAISGPTSRKLRELNFDL